MSAKAELLQQRYEKLKEEGLIDIKFAFGSLSEATLDEVCGSINAALDAVERKDYVEFPRVGDSSRPN